MKSRDSIVVSDWQIDSARKICTKRWHYVASGQIQVRTVYMSHSCITSTVY